MRGHAAANAPLVLFWAILRLFFEREVPTTLFADTGARAADALDASVVETDAELSRLSAEPSSPLEPASDSGLASTLPFPRFDFALGAFATAAAFTSFFCAPTALANFFAAAVGGAGAATDAGRAPVPGATARGFTTVAPTTPDSAAAAPSCIPGGPACPTSSNGSKGGGGLLGDAARSPGEAWALAGAGGNEADGDEAASA